MMLGNQNVAGSNQRSGVRRVVDRVSVRCAAMAMVPWESSLNSMLPPQKPREVDGDQELPPAFPIDDRLRDGGEPLLPDEGEMCPRARMDTGESLETRQSYFSNNMPTRVSINAPPNRILHNRNNVLVENMMKELSTLPGRRRLEKEVASRRQPDPDEEPKKPASPQKQGWSFAGPWFSRATA
ncbi:PCBAB [Symbiodinium sp. CCMP2592]|nr:PCBAB [Symbiodinium sp. CCMP2592]